VDVGPGDEVITTPNTFIATAEAISYTGARPVFVDVDAATANIAPDRIEAAVTDRTKAIVPVHLYGRPAELDPILRIAERRHLAVIEDACQAHGARYRGRPVGTLGGAGAFSFYPGKNLGAYGEGGALLTNDDRIATLARALRSHGEVSRYCHEHIGYNYRMDGFQGAVLRVKLRYLEAWTKRRREIVAVYRERLARARLDLPHDPAHADCVYHLFVAYVEDRDAVRAALLARSVRTAIHYPTPLHLQRAYAWLGHTRGSFPQAERASDRVISLPLFPEMTMEQAEHVAAALVDIVGTR
jgi:dTDP-4-amino-4,6-dideoxygalactose transaminase